MNKKFHSITTKYNFLFNGNNLYEEGINNLNSKVAENFWELLPIEKFEYYGVDDEDRENNFTESEKKATLAIQKHSMNIAGKEKNSKMDEAYFLLGKSRYFDNRFIPALEAFNYILYKYPTSELINKVKIWKEKINIRLDQNQYAIDNLKDLLNETNLLKEERSLANSFIAQAFINIEQNDSALYYLKRSYSQFQNTKNNPRKTFLLAQLYQALSINDTAHDIYSEIINLNRKIPRKFYIQSYINRSTTSDSIDTSILELKELVENFENKQHLDIIFHQIANLNLKKNNNQMKNDSIVKENDSIAVKYFNKSIKSDSSDDFLIAKNYLQLAELNFRQKNYLIAGLYYDTTLTKLNDKSLNFRKINKKRENLNDLIFYETVSLELDSIIELVNMSKENRKKYFKEYISKIKKNEKDKNNKQSFGSNVLQNPTIDSESALFYFYNPNAVAFGKNDFKMQWGSRRLEDNWRWSSLNTQLNNKDILVEKKNNLEDSIFSVSYYIKSIPKDSDVIDSLLRQRNDAYFKLGAIYKDKFMEYEMSNEKLITLLKNNPEKKLIPPTKYFIYKNYLKLELKEEAEKLKSDIITNHSSSNYSAKLLNPNASISIAKNAEELYSDIYILYKNQKYLEVIDSCDENIMNFNEQPIVAKFEFLKAQAIARAYGYEDYISALNFIKLNYSTSIEGKEAELILSKVLPLVKDSKFKKNDKSNNFKIVYKFDKKSEHIDSFRENLKNYISEIKYLDLLVSKDYYNNTSTFVVIHGLKSYDGGFGLLERLNNNFENKSDITTVMSSDNYKIVQIHKNFDKFSY